MNLQALAKSVREHVERKLLYEQQFHSEPVDINYIRSQVAASLLSDVQELLGEDVFELAVNTKINMAKVLIFDIMDSVNPRLKKMAERV